MSPIIISVAVFVGVAALVGGVAFMLRGDRGRRGRRPARRAHRPARQAAAKPTPLNAELLASTLDDGTQRRSRSSSRGIFNLRLLFEQADVTMSRAEVPDHLRRPGGRRAASLPLVAGIQRRACAPSSACFLALLAAGVAAVQTQAAAEEVRRAIARSAWS